MPRRIQAAPKRGAGAAAGNEGGVARPAIGAALLALALVAAWLPGRPVAADRPSRAWRGYQTLLVRSDIADAGGLQKVVDALGPGVVSELTATVNFWDFTGVKNVAIARINARIDPADPRHDRVMDALPGYFHSTSNLGSRWTIAYIPSGRAGVVDYLRILPVLGLPVLGQWRMPEFDALRIIVTVAGLLALAALIARPFGRDERLVLPVAFLGALLWVPFLLPGGIARTAVALFVFAAWCAVVRVFIDFRGADDKLLRAARDPLGRFLASAGMALVLFAPASGFSSAALAGYGGSVIASVLVYVALAAFLGRATGAQGRRRRFDPVPIVKGPAASARPVQAGFFVALAVIIAVAGITVFRSVPVPTPVPVPGLRDFSWESLVRLAGHDGAARLPDMSALVTHEAFQQTIAFGRPWGLPHRDERVYVREFSVNAPAGSIVESFRSVKVFDSAWLDSVTRRFAPGSIEGMLIAQGVPVTVAFRGQERALPRELPLAVLALLVFSGAFARERRAVPLMRNALLRLNGAARRSQGS